MLPALNGVGWSKKVMKRPMILALLGICLLSSQMHAAIDTSKIGVEEGDVITWKVTQNTYSDLGVSEHKVRNDSNGNTHKMREGEELKVRINSVDEDINVSKIFETEEKLYVETLNANFSHFAGLYIYTDWDHWASVINETDGYFYANEDLDHYSVIEWERALTDNSDVFGFKVNVTFDLSVGQYDTRNVFHHAEYRKSDGMLNLYHHEYINHFTDGTKQEYLYKLEYVSTSSSETSTSDGTGSDGTSSDGTGSDGTGSDENGAFGFILPMFVLPITLLVIYRKFRK
ncbi:MAG: hypothetical protein ACXAD7_03945 [Candidatus Kariarchaeaceae archaeon]